MHDCVIDLVMSGWEITDAAVESNLGEWIGIALAEIHADQELHLAALIFLHQRALLEHIYTADCINDKLAYRDTRKFWYRNVMAICARL